MKEDIKDLWVDALKSGMYDQGQGCLLYEIGPRNDKRYCCWGVLCHISEQGHWDKHKGEIKYLDHTTYPPIEVQNWAGIVGGDRSVLVLAEMNDNGKSFKEIADYIEKNWKEL